MLGTSLRILQSPTQLAVTSPSDPVFVFVVLGFLVIFALPFLLGIFFGKTSLVGGAIRVVVFGGFVCLMGVALSHSKVTLDGSTNNATIEDTFLYKHSQKVIPLSSIDHARVAHSSLTSNVQLILTDGRAISLSVFTQQGNKEAAALAINRFLESHTGREIKDE